MKAYFDRLEVRTSDERESQLFSELPARIAHAKSKSPYFAELLSEVDSSEVNSRRALAALPVTRKSKLVERQKQALPFGGLTTVACADFARIFASPGPVYEPEGRRPDYWRAARALFAAGFRKGDIVHNSFSYHLTPAGSVFETGAHALGCAVVPGGVGQTELQLRTIADVRPDGYVGTPSFLRILLEKAAESGANVGSISKALVSGEAFSPSLRAAFKGAGITAYQCYATADLGLIAYESEALEGMILDEHVIVEIVNPGTGDPVENGSVGEVLVTSLTPEYPLIRFSTGDLSAFLDGRSSCGRTNQRIKGWMGRADQATKVRGMFVHPMQIEEIIRRHNEIGAARMIVSRDAQGNDEMILNVEAQLPLGDSMRISDTVHAVTRLRGRVVQVPTGSLPKDGVMVADTRKYE
jgi:phenylacetate-coenzyme A ligase PaaK-like adenylate-forming protein